jgi:hypothetical protein
VRDGRHPPRPPPPPAPARPGITDAKRGGWRALHYGWGALTILGGIANCGLGIVLIHGLQDDSVAKWTGPTVALLLLFAFVGVFLEAKRQEVGGALGTRGPAWNPPGAARRGARAQTQAPCCLPRRPPHRCPTPLIPCPQLIRTGGYVPSTHAFSGRPAAAKLINGGGSAYSNGAHA